MPSPDSDFSSGFSLKTSSKWFDIRIKRQSSKKDYLKLHIVIDVETNVILQFTITGWRGSDSREFKRLIRDLPRLGKAAVFAGTSSTKSPLYIPALYRYPATFFVYSCVFTSTAALVACSA